MLKTTKTYETVIKLESDIHHERINIIKVDRYSSKEIILGYFASETNDDNKIALILPAETELKVFRLNVPVEDKEYV